MKKEYVVAIAAVFILLLTGILSRGGTEDITGKSVLGDFMESASDFFERVLGLDKAPTVEELIPEETKEPDTGSKVLSPKKEETQAVKEPIPIVSAPKPVIKPIDSGLPDYDQAPDDSIVTTLPGDFNPNLHEIPSEGGATLAILYTADINPPTLTHYMDLEVQEATSVSDEIESLFIVGGTHDNFQVKAERNGNELKLTMHSENGEGKIISRWGIENNEFSSLGDFVGINQPCESDELQVLEGTSIGGDNELGDGCSSQDIEMSTGIIVKNPTEGTVIDKVKVYLSEEFFMQYIPDCNLGALEDFTDDMSCIRIVMAPAVSMWLIGEPDNPISTNEIFIVVKEFAASGDSVDVVDPVDMDEGEPIIYPEECEIVDIGGEGSTTQRTGDTICGTLGKECRWEFYANLSTYHEGLYEDCQGAIQLEEMRYGFRSCSEPFHYRTSACIWKSDPAGEKEWAEPYYGDMVIDSKRLVVLCC